MRSSDPFLIKFFTDASCFIIRIKIARLANRKENTNIPFSGVIQPIGLYLNCDANYQLKKSKRIPRKHFFFHLLIMHHHTLNKLHPSYFNPICIYMLYAKARLLCLFTILAALQAASVPANWSGSNLFNASNRPILLRDVFGHYVHQQDRFEHSFLWPDLLGDPEDVPRHFQNSRFSWNSHGLQYHCYRSVDNGLHARLHRWC